jgi:hypothetical protein
MVASGYGPPTLDVVKLVPSPKFQTNEGLITTFTPTPKIAVAT